MPLIQLPQYISIDTELFEPVFIPAGVAIGSEARGVRCCEGGMKRRARMGPVIQPNISAICFVQYDNSLTRFP